VLGTSHEGYVRIGVGRGANYTRLSHIYLRSCRSYQTVGFKSYPLKRFDRQYGSV